MKSLASTSKIISMPESVYYELLDKAFPDTYPVIEKELNLDEKRFLDELNNLISQDVDAAIEYLNSKEFKQALFDYRDLKEDFFKDVEDQCYDIANSKAQSVEEFMGNFYEAGAKQGLSQIMRKLNYTPADEQAFFFVNQYAFTKVKNLGSDLVGGMREHIWRGIAEGQSQDKIAHSIENLPLKPLPDKKLSVHQRAIQIAHTESSRAVNIGKLQSWADYGINLVKINEIGDGLECKICLNLISQNPYNIKDADGLIPAHPNCYDDETLVYTNNGWKLFKDIIKDVDEILSLNPETRETEFIKDYNIISHVNDYEYMYWIHNKWFDTCVTPNHDCFIYQRKSKKGIRSLYPEFRKPTELNTESKFYRTCNNNNVSPELINVNGLKFKPEDYAFLMAWYISEGSILHNETNAKKEGYYVDIVQLIPENRKVLEVELKRISEYLGIKFRKKKDRFQLLSKELYDYVKPLGYSNEKYIPNELFSLSRSDLNIFLDNYVKGDGHERECSNEICCNSFERTLFTSSTRLVDDLSYVILLAGYYPSIKVMSKAGTVVKHHNGSYAQNYDVYSIRINRSKYATVPNLNIDEIPYTGMVYCVELFKYHTLWTKRNGKTTWNGNCRHTWVPVTLAENENARDFKDLPDKPISNPPVMTGGTVNNPKSQIVGDGTINPLNNASEEAFKNLHKPEDIAKYYGYEYAEGKGKSLFYDAENDTPIVIDKYFTKGVGSKKYLDMTSNGKYNYDLKDLIKDYHDAPSIMKKACTSIMITGTKPNMMRMSHFKLVGGNTDLNNHSINIFPRSLEYSKGTEGNFKQALYHEMGHALDLSVVNHEPHNKLMTYTMSEDSDWVKAMNADDKLHETTMHNINNSPSNYGNDRGLEDFAESVSMTSFAGQSDKTEAVIVSTREGKTSKMSFDEWVKCYPNRYNYLRNKFKTLNESDLTNYVSATGG